MIFFEILSITNDVIHIPADILILEVGMNFDRFLIYDVC